MNNNNDNNIDDFLNNLYENWIDMVIENVPLVQNFNENYNQQFLLNNGFHFRRNRYRPSNYSYTVNTNANDIGTSNRAGDYFAETNDTARTGNFIDVLQFFRDASLLDDIMDRQTINQFIDLIRERRLAPNNHNSASQMQENNLEENVMTNQQLPSLSSIIDDYGIEPIIEPRIERQVEIPQVERPRVIRHRRQSRIIANNNDITNLLGDLYGNIVQYISEPAFEDVKVTISEEEFNNLKTEKINDNNIEEYNTKDCNICLESYNINDDITFLPCNHFFHKKCIHHWACNEKISCPVCRKDIREK